MHKLRMSPAVLAAVFAALALLVALEAGVAHAQSGALPANAPPAGSLHVQARAGFDGQGRVGGWLPLAVDVINQARVPFEGEVRVRVSTSTRRGPFSRAPTVYTIPAAVPGRAHRRFSFDVRVPSTSTRLQATVVAPTGDVIAEQEVSLNRVPLGEMFCGILGRDAKAYSFLGALSLPPPLRHARVVPLIPAELPTVGHLLGSFDCLVLDGANSAMLRPEQLEALQVWLNGGGLLFAVAGSAWQANLGGLPPSLLPVEPQGLTSVESLDSLEALAGQPLEQEGPWLVLRSRLRLGMGAGRVLASQEGIPLVVAAKRGDGGVVYLAFDPTSPALQRWQGQAELWRYLLSHASVDSGVGSALVRPYLRWGRTPRWALTDYSDRQPTDARWLVALSFLTALAGASSVLMFGRQGQPARAVLALAGIGLVGTAAALLVAASRAEAGVEVNHVSIIRPVAQGEAAYTRTYVTAWPRHEDTYSLQLPSFALPFALWYPSRANSTDPDEGWSLTVAQTQRPHVRDLPLELSTLTTFAFDGQLPADAVRLDGDLVLDGENRLRGTITSALHQPVEHLALVVDTQVVPLGTLDPGQSVAVDTTVPDRAAAGYGASHALPTAMLGEPSKGSPAPHRDVLDSLFTQRFLIRRAELRGPTLIGWLSQAPKEIGVGSPEHISVRGSAILLAPARVRLRHGYAGPVSPSLLTRRTLGGAPTFSPDRDYYTVSPGESINLQFTLPPADGPWNIDALLVTLEADTQAREAREFLDIVSLFNWRTGDWQGWQLGGMTAAIPEPAKFISATGDVRLRYALDSSLAQWVRPVHISQLDVTPVLRVADG